MRRTIVLMFLLCLSIVLSYAEQKMEEQQFRDFLAKHIQVIEPLFDKMNLAYWDAATTGREEEYSRYNQFQLDIRTIYSNPDEFKQLKTLKESGAIQNPDLQRQLEKLYLSYLGNQFDPDLLKQIVDLDTKIQKVYSSYRGEIDGEQVTNSDVYQLMTSEGNTKKRELAWKASKQVGCVIVDDLIRLVKLRNRAARKLGFDNYHTFSITLSEQRIERIDRIFQELERETRQPFLERKSELDRILAKNYGIPVSELKPWHYHDPFFQRTPLVYELDLDLYYKKHDVKELAATYYKGIGLPVDSILQRSDLYDREGKYPHAFSQDMNRKGDVRILCNLNNDERWMETILHELGHAVYSQYHDSKEPYLFREPAHSFTTEAVAMFFGRLSRNAVWMENMLKLKPGQREEIEKVSWKYTQFQQLLFARWAMVMYHFEKQLYANPDQDLNSLWWELVKTYQFVNSPSGLADAGWASKLHFTSAPCYYHNYMLGELLASQFTHTILNNVLKQSSESENSFAGEKQVGDFFRRHVFAPGAKYHWDGMIQRATGENLTPDYFIDQFVRDN